VSSYLPFLVIGLTTGAVYGLVATGLVLTYRTSGLFNFGYGAIAATGAFVFYWLNVQLGLSWGIALFLVVGVLGPALGLISEPLARGLAGASTTYKVVGTVGVILIVQGAATIRYGTGVIVQPQYLPAGSAFEIFGTVVVWSQVIVMLVGLAAVVGLHLFLRHSRLGVATRAVVDDAELLDLTGTSPTRVRRIAWIVGSMLAVLAGALIAPNSNLDAVVLTFLIIQAFGAAAIGAFSNLPLAYAGGAIVGVAAALSTKWSNIGWLGGLPSVVPFLILLAVLLVRPQRLPRAAAALRARPRVVWRAPARVRLGTAVVVVGVLILVPTLVGFRVDSYTNALIEAMILLSLGLLVRMSGQVSLCQLAFAAVGAMAFYHVRVGLGAPWLVSLLAAGLVTVPIGAIVAIPAIRLSGLYLSLATLGFGVGAQYMLYPLSIMFATGTATRTMPRPSWGGSDRGYYFVVLAIVVVTGVVVVAVNQGRLGRLSRGMSDSPVALATLGLNLRVTRVLVFCLAAFIAGIAGALGGVLYTTASADSYQAYQSLVLVAVLALAPFGEPWYALVGCAGVALVPVYLSGQNTTNWLNVLFGVFAILVALGDGPQTAPAAVRRFLDRLGGRHDAGLRGGAAAPRPPALAPSRSREGPGLEVDSLTVAFGGLVAVDGMSLAAPPGRVTGLIGPNGAGKTTTFNACTGLTTPRSGRVLLHGEDVTGLDPSARARRGLGRTFQRMELFDSLTVRDNVALGCEASMGGARPWQQLRATRGQRKQIEAATAGALATCGIEGLAARQVGLLSTGERRLVDLARCVAGHFDVLLLDEPSSGLDRRERARFGTILRRLAARAGVGILLVEHDMALVLDVCDYIYVLDFGELIFEGTAAEVQASDRVRAAYLGDAPLDSRPEAELARTSDVDDA
jgi:ABC-type branched-subunit amino acid transport system ATPase component/branched-subunit amino acid ABC-type transport system permease component